tara:strand:- start:1518 stop:1748 length:231 start_codon:yes stop_codon:yes gene_type:complete
MDYNYTDAPYYANLNEGTLTVDGTQTHNLVITKEVINEEPPHEKTLTFYTYDVTGLSVTEIDQLTRIKIQELINNG